MIGEFAKVMLADEKPSRESVLFVCGALASWLENGGSLEHAYFKVIRPKSKHTPAFIWRQWQQAQEEAARDPAPNDDQ